jgi:hypothetical protein
MERRVGVKIQSGDCGELDEIADLSADRPLCPGEILVAGGRATVGDEAGAYIENTYNGGPSAVDAIDRVSI